MGLWSWNKGLITEQFLSKMQAVFLLINPFMKYLWLQEWLQVMTEALKKNHHKP